MKDFIFTLNRRAIFITIATAIVLVNVFSINRFGREIGSFAEVADSHLDKTIEQVEDDIHKKELTSDCAS